MRAAPEAFRKLVREIDDPDLRFEFVQRALSWAGGDAQAAEYFKDFEKHNRLKRTLKKITEFGQTFDARSLHAVIHFVAPPKSSEPDKLPPEKKQASHQAGLDVEAEVVEKATAVDVSTGRIARRELIPGSDGIQVFGDLPFVLVPRGKFLMGSREENKLAYEDEKPQKTIEIPEAYWMAQFPVTNEQYAGFVEANSRKHAWIKDWKKKMDHPVVNVSWNDAQAYCQWLNETVGTQLPTGHVFRLPTEAEWEKAARGEFGFEWPWGNEFDKNKCNSSEGNKGDTTPVGSFSAIGGDSPFGLADMVGNVWEWTQSLFQDYPYNAIDGREDLKNTGSRVCRGGSFYDFQR